MYVCVVGVVVQGVRVCGRGEGASHLSEDELPIQHKVVYLLQIGIKLMVHIPSERWDDRGPVDTMLGIT